MRTDGLRAIHSYSKPPDQEHLRRVDRLIASALDLPRGERTEFLERSCAGDGTLERDAKRLLASCEAAEDNGDFLKGSAGDLANAMWHEIEALSASTEQALLMDLAAALPDRYVVTRRLGRGATASVYQAEDKQSGRTVAIKVLRPELAETTASTRFQREVRLMSELAHPRILPVLDVGQHDRALYYVLPYMESGSLRDRLTSEKQLPVRDAIGITLTIAYALEHAHSRGLIHRDVKPENILFSGGEAYLADFGIARAIERAQGQSSTTTGLVRGTVPYMSPEQASGSEDLDGRSDVYALGCVLYEMLAGVHAFVGPSPQAILAQKLTHSPRDVRVYRPSVSARLERVVMRALHIAPADRFQSAGEFAAALEALTDQDLVALGDRESLLRELPPPSRRRLLLLAGVLATSVVVAAALVQFRPGVSRRTPPRVADTTIVAVLPLEGPVGSGNEAIDHNELLHEAMSWWRGVVLIDRFVVAEAVRRLSLTAPELTIEQASTLATSVGAGRYVRGRLAAQGEAWRLYAALFDVDGTNALSQASMLVPNDLPGAAAVYARLTRTLLLRVAADVDSASVGATTNSLPAAQAMSRAQVALDEWDLVAADSALQAGVRFDPDYMRASLLLAQVRAWRGLPSSSWSSLADRAVSGAARLSWKDARQAHALALLARQQYEDACALYEQLRRRNDNDFAAWYGLGMCRTMDRGVVRDSESPSGWRFRSSYQLAVKAYTRAFQILPAVHRGYERGAFEELLRIMLLVETDVKRGRGVDRDSAIFQARPGWVDDGDTLALIPYPWEAVSLGAAEATPPGFAKAVQHQRSLFVDIASRWSSAYPTSAGAKQAVAIAMELLGDPRAIDTMRLASELAADRPRKVRLGASEILLRVKFGSPSNLRQLDAARVLAESLLALSSPTPEEAYSLAPIAALVGRCSDAERLARLANPEDFDIPLAEHVLADAQVVLARSALGCAAGPSAPTLADLVRLLETDAAIRSHDGGYIDAKLLMRPALLAARLDSAAVERAARSTGHPLLVAARALARHQPAEVRTTLSEFRRGMRVNGAPWTPDMMYPGAVLLVAIGDTVDAVDWLDRILADARSFDPRVLSDPTRTATFLRAAALRADLARATGDVATARRWSVVVATLWRRADDQPAVTARRMAEYGGPR